MLVDEGARDHDVGLVQLGEMADVRVGIRATNTG
jgi:hypothetical protein